MMTMTTIVPRTLAIAIAVAAVLDPAIPVNRRRPVAVELLTGPGDRAIAVREKLLTGLGNGVTVVRPGQGDAIVAIDTPLEPASIRDNVRISAVMMGAGSNVRLLAAAATATVLVGQDAAIEIDAAAHGLAGRTSAIVVTRKGTEIGRIDHQWSTARHQRIHVPFLAIEPGTESLRVSATPLTDETRADDNAIDARVTIAGRPLRIAFLEPRPSWSAGFVRRAIESDAVFQPASIVRPSRGIDVTTDDAPFSGAGGLERFDVVVVGAPEDLRASEIDALRTFAAVRGGTIVLLPDRRPSGPYAAAFLMGSAFDELLLDTPVTLQAGGVRASELAIPRGAGRAMRALATLPDRRPVIVAWPMGEGTVVFSGALDAWRFRGESEDRFGSFWRGALATAALAAPPPLRVEIDPPVARPNTEVQIVVRLRRTEWQQQPDGSIRMPPVGAVATQARPGATSDTVRVWPTAEAGVFRGVFVPAAGGDYYIHATAGRAQHATRVVVTDLPESADEDEVTAVAAATGGVVTPADDLSPLVQHLRSLGGGSVPSIVHPMRSGWWTLPFALALCAEWAVRRRRGER